MYDNLLDDGTAPDLVAEMRALVDETRRAIEASQAILDRCAAQSIDEAVPMPGDDDGSAVLGEITDGLLHAYRFAKQDGDPLTVTLVEKALFHIGRRLARGVSPAEVGLSRH